MPRPAPCLLAETEELRRHILLAEAVALPVARLAARLAARHTAEEVGLRIRPVGLAVGIVLVLVEGPAETHVSD